MKVVVYTAIFGDYDTLKDPYRYFSQGIDYICFTNQNIESDIWKVIKVPLWNNNPIKTARMYKILPHKYLSEYDVSIWVDANILIKGDLMELIIYNKYDFYCYSHYAVIGTYRDCVYEEAKIVLYLEKDIPEKVYKQMTKYYNERYPKNNGLYITTILIRNHNNVSVIDAMNRWWKEVMDGSHRDQLSINYAIYNSNLINFYCNNSQKQFDSYFKRLSHKYQLFYIGSELTNSQIGK